jgi:hypothetical protein
MYPNFYGPPPPSARSLYPIDPASSIALRDAQIATTFTDTAPATYVRTGTTLVVTKAGHGYTGGSVRLAFLSSTNWGYTPLRGSFAIASYDSGTFTISGFANIGTATATGKCIEIDKQCGPLLFLPAPTATAAIIPYILKAIDEPWYLAWQNPHPAGGARLTLFRSSATPPVINNTDCYIGTLGDADVPTLTGQGIYAGKTIKLNRASAQALPSIRGLQRYAACNPYTVYVNQPGVASQSCILSQSGLVVPPAASKIKFAGNVAEINRVANDTGLRLRGYIKDATALTGPVTLVDIPWIGAFSASLVGSVNTCELDISAYKGKAIDIVLCAFDPAKVPQNTVYYSSISLWFE